MNVTSATSSRAVQSVSSSTTWSNAASSYPTRSILFTQTTKWGIRSSDAM